MDVKTLSTVIGHVSAATTLDIYTHITDTMQRDAAITIDRGIGKAEPAQKTKVEQGTSQKRSFQPYKGTRRKPGTGCISQINETLWEGRYSPRWPDGKKHPPQYLRAHSGGMRTTARRNDLRGQRRNSGGESEKSRQIERRIAAAPTREAKSPVGADFLPSIGKHVVRKNDKIFCNYSIIKTAKITRFWRFLVRVARFELTASWSRTMRATNCATPGYITTLPLDNDGII